MKKLLLFTLLSTLLASCSEGFKGGAWIIPAGLLALSVWTWGRFTFGWKSKTAKGSVSSLVFAIILTLASIATYVLMRSDA